MIEIIFPTLAKNVLQVYAKGKPDWLSGDVAFALAMQILGIEADCTRENIDEVPTFIHEKPTQNITTQE